MLFVPDALIFCLMALRGFPSICILTKLFINPSSEGRSGMSLFDRSSVFKVSSFTTLDDNFLILLSFKIKTVRFGHLSKSSNSVNLLKDKARMSSFYDQGASLKEVNLFSLS